MMQELLDRMTFVRRKAEPITEVVLASSPGWLPGMLVDIGGETLMVVGIRHQGDGLYATTRVQLVTPNWRWRLRYRVGKLLRRVWTFIWRLLRGKNG